MIMINGLVGWMRRVFANPVFIYALLAVLIFLSIGRYLGTHPAGFSPAEASARAVSQSPSQILHDPINAPHSILAYGLHAAKVSWRTSLRVSSALYWIAFCLCFYWLAKSLFGKQIGLMGLLVFAALPVFLIMARDGSAAIMFFWPVAVMAAYSRAVRADDSQLAVAVLLIVSALGIYVPGVALWLIVAAFICRQKISGIFEAAEPPVIGAAGLVSILILVPLAAGLIKDWHLVHQLTLIPAHFPGPLNILKDIGWMGIGLFVKLPYLSQYGVGRLPVLNLIMDALVVFGAHALWGAARNKLLALAATVIYAVVLAGLNNNVSVLALAVPALALIAAAGLRYLFIEWRGVFPRNPLAKSLALSLMWVLVIVQLAYGIRYADMAWPQTPNTKNTYVVK